MPPPFTPVVLIDLHFDIKYDVYYTTQSLSTKSTKCHSDNIILPSKLCSSPTDTLIYWRPDKCMLCLFSELAWIFSEDN